MYENGPVSEMKQRETWRVNIKLLFLYVGFCVGGSSDGDPDGRKASGWAKDAEL